MQCETTVAPCPYRDELFPVYTTFECLRQIGIQDIIEIEVINNNRMICRIR